MTAAVQVKAFSGLGARPYLQELAQLRIRVFQDYPYLYDGDMAYEERYLTELGQAQRSVLVAAFAQKTVVGAATGMPLAKAAAEIRAPWEAKNEPLQDWYYFSESVLLPEYRGQGIGKRFMDLRQRWAKEMGFKKFCFCSVLRPDNHAQRPDDYRELAPFWKQMGFEPLEDYRCQMQWKELGESTESTHDMQFWGKTL